MFGNGIKNILKFLEAGFAGLELTQIIDNQSDYTIPTCY